ncbi:type 1 glutamine amidotransferase [Actinoallomurus iriomotensis]|uniref:Aminotransferase n=1 Tax=Actinoallomurus iriomotensis TaxID=478107 RepID=A0A9W6VUJ6_9ACTN|nr:type 1 glutamine amidotransferase [Actinoallomurus iriomotensis]GLY80840.1 aminotransferase [Actinoallomurus iriomotensis]
MTSLPSRRVLVVRNAERSPLGRFLPWFEADGLHIAEVTGDAVPVEPNGFDAVVLLGGGLLPDEDERAPWLAAERELTRSAVARGVPLLGICLGAQVLAAVAGGVVRGEYGRPERGSCRVSLREEAKADPLFAGLPERLRFIQNHRDQITELPPDAVRLAESDACPIQAFRVGERAWGVQFHPEAGADRLDRWDEAALADAGLDLGVLRAEAERAEPESSRHARRLASNFAALVHRTAPVSSANLPG